MEDFARARRELIVRKDHIARILVKDPFNVGPGTTAKQTRGEIHKNDIWTYYKVSVFYAVRRGAKTFHPVLISSVDPPSDGWFAVIDHMDRIHPDFPKENLTLITHQQAYQLQNMGLVNFVIHTVANQK